MSILIFLGILFILVLVHELGHFAVAKWTGMRVDEFGIGFPPKLFGKKYGETEYTFNLFPVGGFVKIYGEDGSPQVSSELSDSRSFTSKNKWAQAAVLVAGISMNILLAWVLIAFAFGIGVRSSVSESEATENAQLIVSNVLPESPAAKATLVPGATIQEVKAGNTTLEKLAPSSFTAFIAEHAQDPITVAYTIGSELRVVQLIPEKGIIPDKLDQPAVGVALSLVDTVSRAPLEAIGEAFTYTVSSIYQITLGIGGLLYDAIRLQADFSQVAGPVGIVGLVGEASAYGITALLMFTAFISLNLAVINILPFPALDGGRLLFVGIEAIKGSPIKTQYVAMLNTAGFFLLILLMVAVTWNDIARIL